METLLHIQDTNKGIPAQLLRKRNLPEQDSLLLESRDMIDPKRDKDASLRFCNFIQKVYWLYLLLMLAVGGLLLAVYLGSWREQSALMMVAFVKFFLAPVWLFMFLILLLFRRNLLLVFVVMLFAGLFAGFVMGIVAQLHFEEAVMLLMSSKARPDLSEQA